MSLSTPPRILLITSKFPPDEGGAPVVYHQLCRNLRRSLLVLAPRLSYLTGEEVAGWRQSDQLLETSITRIDLLRSPIGPGSGIPLLGGLYGYLRADLPVRRAVWKTVSAIIEKERPDVVCLGDLFALAWLGNALRKQIPVIFYSHGDDVSTWTPSKLLSWEATRALASADGVVAVSEFARRQLIARGVRPDLVQVISNGVDTERFQPGPPNPELIERHRLAGKTVLLSLTRLEPRKGVDTVLHALPLIRQRIPDVRLLVVGDGSQQDSLRRLAHDLQLSGIVDFCGYIPHSSPLLVDYYRLADVFLHPNREMPGGEAEGFGLVFLEASACGIPVIGGSTGGVVEAVEHGQTGLLVRGDDPKQLAAATLRILTEPGLAAQMAQSGLGKARRASWQSQAELFQSFCRNIACRRRLQEDND